VSKDKLDKTENVRFRLSGHEKSAFADYCAHLGFNQSVVMRRFVREATSHGPTLFADEQKELKRLRLQIAKKVNSGLVESDPLSQEQIAELKAGLGEVSALMKTILDHSKSRRVRFRDIASG